MTYDLLHRKNLSLITLEKLRELRKDGISFKYKYVCFGYAKTSGMPQFHMYVCYEQTVHILVNNRLTTEGPKLRVINMYPGIFAIQKELGYEDSKILLGTKTEDPPTKPSDFLDD